MKKRLAALASPLLLPASGFYALGAQLHAALYRWGLKRRDELPTLVLSVGNIDAGGSGKTPLVRWLAAAIQEHWPELNVAIASRGYGRGTGRLALVSDGERVLLDAAEGGDEPVMLARSLPGVPVLVAARRSEAVREAAERFGSRLVLLDDGFQHHRLKRDADLVLLALDRPGWMSLPLPAGRRREPRSALRRASLIVLTGQLPEARLRERTARLRRSFAAPLLRGGLQLDRIVPFGGGQAQPASWLEGRRVAIAAAVARPERIAESVRQAGGEVVAGIWRRDHAPWTAAAQRSALATGRRAGAEFLLITEKDEVKWSQGKGGEELPLMVLRSTWRWQEGEQDLWQLLASLAERARKT